MGEIFENMPDVWLKNLPQKSGDQHKYDYGHAFIYAAPKLTGATNLAAQACARIGTGLVTVIAPAKREDLYRCILPPHILVCDSQSYDETHVTAKLYGSGGLSVKPDFKTNVATVLDADALQDLPNKLSPNFVLSPHQGEFDRAFSDIDGDRVARVKKVSKAMNCVIVLKGAETIIADPDRRVMVNKHASPWLATAGSGDVLAGMITGLLAQKMPVFDACCAAVWIHGECALHFGSHLVASDLPDLIPLVLRHLLDKNQGI